VDWSHGSSVKRTSAPGAKIDRVLDALIGSRSQVIVCRYEQNAALIAAGIGRMTGKAGMFQPRRFLASNGQQTMGVAIPWAIAACLVRPGEKVVSMSGDGAFLMSAMKLETAVRLNCNFVHLVWRDGFYNMVRIQQQAKYGRETAVALGPVDVVKYAEAFEATGLAIHSAAEIAPTLRKALELPGPVLIDVPIDYGDNAKLIQAIRSDAVT
jgi:acetolactate synthase-1/2/3 large subunit